MEGSPPALPGRMVRSSALLAFVLVACAAKPAPEPVPALEVPPMPHAPATASSEPPPPPREAPPKKLVFEHCVLHAGGGSRSTKKTKLGDGGFSESTHASCYYGAECVQHPGNAQAGDGFAGLKCEDSHCTCTLRSATTEEKEEESFDLDEICGSADLAKKLLIERCMKGMPPPK